MSDNAVIVFASFRPIAGKQQALHELLSFMVEHTRAEPGCERYDLYRRHGDDADDADDADEVTFHLFERYRNDEALQAHRDSGHYVEYRRRVTELLANPIEVLVLDGLDVVR